MQGPAESELPAPTSPAASAAAIQPCSPRLFPSSQAEGVNRRVAIAVDLSDERGEGAGGVPVAGVAGDGCEGTGALISDAVELHPVPEEEEEYRDASDEHKGRSGCWPRCLGSLGKEPMAWFTLKWLDGDVIL
ncbi:hypothetical protein Taro_030485 [Colocasia esculenta]|uniref:Uncharacterized protein n=1 Tax=Colocasia esculenta TaxID=4460 RepID=A0A843VLI2_COLES|nr:hypothetical protein [Colocasia esculenta]